MGKRCGQKLTYEKQLFSLHDVFTDEARNVEKSLLTGSQAFPVAENALASYAILRAYIKRRIATEMSKDQKPHHNRSAITGRYISDAAAARHPKTTVIESVKPSNSSSQPKKGK